MKIGKREISPLDLLLVFVPIAAALHYLGTSGTWVFIASGLAIIPLAGLLGEATEHLADHVGPGIGGLLNATFGNAAELIIAIFAVQAGFYGVVKASIAGSIIGNLLLVLGASMIAGGLKRETQSFNPIAAGMSSTLLLLSTAGLVVPALFYYLLSAHGVPGDEIARLDRDVSLDVAIVLFVTYALSLVFSLQTHKHLYDTTSYGQEGAVAAEHVWSLRKSSIILAVSTLFVAIMSEYLVHSVEEATASWDMTEVFVGVIIVAIVGNAAEHSAAILMARKDKMDIAVTIAIGSSTQVALLLAPVLVFLSYLIGPEPMDLVFTPLEVLAVVLSAVLVNFVALDGKSHWMEGVQLLALYLVLGIAFYFLPPWS